MFKLTHNNSVLRQADGACIPFDPANSDYQKYLKWVDEGNTADAADPLPNPRIAEIKARLLAIDLESIRALRAKSLGKDSQQDVTKLSDLDGEAALLRTEMAGG